MDSDFNRQSSSIARTESPTNKTVRPFAGGVANGINASQIPSLTLPKGGGALKGIDEKFIVNAVNGTNAMAVSLPVAPARSGFSPSLSLNYSSGFGNGPFGLGWTIGVPSIKRKTEQELPKYQDAIDSDTFILSDAEDLIPLLIKNTATGGWEQVIRETTDYIIKQYRPRIEGVWARIEQWKKKSTGEIHWRTISPNNVTSLYGVDNTSRIANPADDTLKIFEWRLSHSFDDKGNLIIYKYKQEDFTGVSDSTFEKNRSANNCTNLYLKRILYGNKTPYKRDDSLPPDNDFLFETVLDYGEHDRDNPQPNDIGIWDTRSDPFSFFRAGFDIRTYRICKRVLLFHKFDELPITPYLVNALEIGYENFPGKAPTKDHLEGFTYLKTITQRGYLYHSEISQYSSKTLPPLNYYYQPHEWDTDIKQISTEDVFNAPVGIDFDKYQWIDLYTEGLSGILSEKNDGWYYKRNLGHGDFTAATLVKPKPSFTGLSTNALQLQDLEGVGDQYLVNWSQEPKGFFRFTDDENWQPFRRFESIPNRDLLNDPHVRFIDLNGDGLPDLLITEDELFEWHESKGEKGFGKANFINIPLNDEHGPRLVFSDLEQTIFLADMSGDGLTDIVRIYNSEICYWANLGYGRFSVKITMENAPFFDHEDKFNPAYLRFTDIDGSGTTDLIYLGKNDFRVWLNLNGNSWTEAPKIISSFPAIDNLADISALDLLGTGTSCIVWSSPLPKDSQSPLRYIDLMNSRKPHLLNFYENNTGKEVSFDYLPSTHFYIEDRKQGKPWATKLPFPVHVVAKVRSEDKIRETVFTSSYSYHHGYFDGKEREFRGFGRVEQLDTEEFSTFSLNDAQNVVEEACHQPPVRTVSWFHIGAPLHKKLLTEIYQGEFYKNETLTEYQLPSPSMSLDWSIQEWREALRACKGLTLRQEIYAEDGTDKQEHPYSVSQSTYQIRQIQPLDKNKYGSFQIISNESISYAYERNPADPRIAHSMTLETDDKGFVTKSCSITYPRVQRSADIPDEVWIEQNKRHVIYSELDYTEDMDTDDEYRIRSTYETRGFELLGIPQPAGQFLTKKDLQDYLTTATTISFDEETDGTPQKRLSNHARIYFQRNDLNGALPLGQRQSLGLVFRTLQLAFTDGLAAKHYGNKVTSAMLIQAGYEHSEGDSDWWAPSGINLYPPDAANGFYIPIGFRDALGSESHITYDQYVLLSETSTNAIGNTVSVENDYRTLSPHLLTDPNLNRSAVETDELGLIIKTAVMGKAGANEGDSLADPTTRLEYDFLNWMNHGSPNFIHTFAREQHGVSNPQWQESYAYSDGGGSVIMSKIQAEPGKAKRWNPDIHEIEEIHTSTRWVGNGRTILNNKGNPIKQFEPYFSTTHDYESEPALVETGVTPILFYDPLGRNIRTQLPNGTFTKVEFDPWYSKYYDTNDTVKESQWYINKGSPDPQTDPEPNDPERRAAWLAAKHYNTPTTLYTDSLGRTVYSISDYGNNKTTAVRNETDLMGRYAKVFDQVGREVSLGYINLLGSPIHGESAEKGENWIFQDVLGRMVKLWDNDLREFRSTYDPIHRPVSAFVLENGNEILFNHTVYGDSHPSATSLNLKGLAYQLYDQVGVTTIKQVDFKGNPLEIERRLTREFKQTVNWQSLEGITDFDAIDSAADSQLETEIFFGRGTFDALNRPTEAILPDGTIMRPRYNEANYLDSLEAQIMGRGDFITFLENQDYNARGQREHAKYGNGTLTKYFYDPKTFRLTNLLTTQNDTDAASASLQNLKYTHDPVGNITRLIDDALQTHYFHNNVVRPEHQFEYDATYQLIRATGREHAGIGGNAQRNQHDLPFIAQLPHSNDATAVRIYTENYQYDDLGNILLLQHITSDSSGNWTRRYRYEYQDDASNKTNRLAATSLPGDSVSGPFSAVYSHDLHGNMTGMPHLQGMVWNFLDHLKAIPLGGGGTVFYVYGVSGMRRRKIIERNGGRRIERIYLGAVEIYREYSANGTLIIERWTVHISDDTGRIAQVDTKTVDSGNSDPVNPLNISLIRYQYTNHLGSSTLETDEDGNVISYEEYHPFGTSAYRSSKSNVDLSLKQYRFTGKEKDDETGFYYFGARYYAAWLGRWTSSDPAGIIPGLNQFRFVHNNPIVRIDPNGLDDNIRQQVTDRISRALESNTDEARRILNQHYRGNVHQEDGRQYRFRENSFRWNAELGQNFGNWDPVQDPEAVNEDDSGTVMGAREDPETGGGETRGAGAGNDSGLEAEQAPATETEVESESSPTQSELTSVPEATRVISQEVARPSSVTGTRPRGTLHLWSGAQGKADARAAIRSHGSGWMMGDIGGAPTPEHAAGERAFARARARAPGGQLTQAEFERIWGPRSASVVGRGAFAGHPVQAHGNPAPTSIQARYEWPARAVGGTAAGGLFFGSGMFTAISGGQDPNPGVGIPLVILGVGEATSGIIYGSGAILGAEGAMAIGTAAGTAFGGTAAAIGFGVASVRSFERGDTAGGVVNALGAVGGALLIASLFTPVGWVGLLGIGLVGIAAGFNLGRWLSN